MYTSTLYMLELSNDLIHAPLRTSGLTDHAPVVAAHDVVHFLAEPRRVAELEHKTNTPFRLSGGGGGPRTERQHAGKRGEAPQRVARPSRRPAAARAREGGLQLEEDGAEVGA